MTTGSAHAERMTSVVDVLVVDDHRSFGDAMRIAVDLQPGLRCRTAVPSAEAALAAIGEDDCPDVVLLDVGLPGMDGITAIRELTARCPDVRIILLSADTSAETLLAAVEAGAHGFLPKSFPFTRVLQLVQSVEEDVIAEPLSLERALLLAADGRDRSDAAHELDLTEREYEILLLLGEGMPVKQAAKQLHMSVNTCRGHVASLLRKFDVHSQLAAVVAAAKMGLLPNLRSTTSPAPTNFDRWR